jgi:hypothetical protein
MTCATARRARSLDDALALAATAGSLGDLLTLLDRRLHVVPPLLQLAQEALSRKLALEVLDCSLDPFAVDDDLQGLTLYGFARVRQGTGTFADNATECKSRNGARVLDWAFLRRPCRSVFRLFRRCRVGSPFNAIGGPTRLWSR